VSKDQARWFQDVFVEGERSKTVNGERRSGCVKKKEEGLWESEGTARQTRVWSERTEPEGAQRR
jgi:hypothetical protein